MNDLNRLVFAAKERLDKNEKWYYVECMYRMCGFSGSARSPRSFQEYLKNS